METKQVIRYLGLSCIKSHPQILVRQQVLHDHCALLASVVGDRLLFAVSSNTSRESIHKLCQQTNFPHLARNAHGVSHNANAGVLVLLHGEGLVVSLFCGLGLYCLLCVVL